MGHGNNNNNNMAAAPVDFALQDYHTPGNPAAYSGRSNLFRLFSHQPKQQVLHDLYGSDSYTRHREFKRPRPYNPIIVRRIRELVQADLVDIRKLAEHNIIEGWLERANYFLTVIG